MIHIEGLTRQHLISSKFWKIVWFAFRGMFCPIGGVLEYSKVSIDGVEMSYLAVCRDGPWVEMLDSEMKAIGLRKYVCGHIFHVKILNYK